MQGLSGGRVRLAAGTLYGALNTLLERGWIDALQPEEESRKKEYIITQEGLDALRTEHRRLRELAENGSRFLREDTQ